MEPHCAEPRATLLTVTWPAKRPPTSMTNGRHWPSLAWWSRDRVTTRYDDGRGAAPGGTVASHGRSHSWLRARTACHSSASDLRSARTTTPSDSSRAGQPGAGLMVAPDDLLHRVAHDGLEDAQAVLHSPAGAGEVDDQAVAGDPGETAREHRGRDSLGHPGRADRLGDARHLAVEQRGSGLRRAVGGREPGAAGGEHEPGARGDGRRDRVAHRVAVGHDHRVVAREALLAQP